MYFGWIPFLLFYIWWLRRMKPHRRVKVYEFPACKFAIQVKQW